jgi:2-polyprenyl-6-methoxyphenol hydroxylase-like FAD-dependent oxidoreductase
VPDFHRLKERSVYDAIIVGARCAGSALGLLLARRGYRILLVDRATFPSDMPMSTHFVHQRGVACLARWGLREQVVATQSPPVSRFAIDVGPFTLTGTAPPVDGEPDAFAPHRLLLDNMLVQAAIQSGAELREGCPVEQLRFENGRVTGVRAATPRGIPFTESARLVVGADGPGSRVAAAVQAAEHHAQPAQQGSAWIYWQDVPLTGVEIYLRNFEGVYAFPSSKGTVVGANWAMERFRLARRDPESSYLVLVQRVAPQLAARIAHARRADERLYLGSTRNFFRTAHGAGWVLLGDAHYKKDFCTAQGITDAFCDAERLADAMEQGFSGQSPLEDALAAYARQSVAWALPFYELTCQMATFAPPPPDLLAIYRSLQGNQAAIDRFIGLITEATSPVEFFAPAHIQGLLAQAPERPH